MKIKHLVVSIIAVLLSSPLFAQNGAVNGYCNTGATHAITQGLNSLNFLQGEVPSCTVTVYQTGTSNLATIYSNSTGTPMANPFTASTLGKWDFYALGTAAYDVVLSGGIHPNTYPSPVTISDLVPSNISDGQIIASQYCTTPGILDGTCIYNAAQAGNNVYLAPVGSNSTYTVTSPIALSESNLKIECAPGVTIATTLTTTNAITFSGVGQSLIGCTLSTANLTTGNIVEVDAATNYLMRDDSVINITANYNIRMDAVSGVTIDNLNTAGHVEIFGGSSYINVVNSTIGSLSLDTGASASPLNFSYIHVNNNMFITNPTVPALGNGAGAFAMDQTSSNTGVISDFEFNNNILSFTGSSSGADFGIGVSIVGSPETLKCSISNNVIDANGQYISTYIMELGVNNCNVENNEINAIDSFNQSYYDIQSYGENNNFTGTTINGWGTTGYGISLSPNTRNTIGNNNVLDGMNISTPVTMTGIAAAIGITCNHTSGSVLFTSITGTTITGSMPLGIAASDNSSGGTCPVSALIDGVTINGATTGIRVYGAATTSSATLGLVAYSGVTTDYLFAGAAVNATGLYGPVSSPKIIPSSLTPSTNYLCYPTAGNTITNVGCLAPAAGSVVASALLTGQTGNVATATIYTPSANGLYSLYINPETSTAGTGSATTVQCNVSYTNPDGHTWTPGISSAVNLLVLGYDSAALGHIAMLAFGAESGLPIQYGCTVTGSGTGYAYRLPVSLVYLGPS